ncbi:Helix-turn-helix domain-containing protein [Amycolatopsis pretoriensis]|uniref:Helix-turn-helix domain-containing protein n=1 Tax=Amycolatopsis pretoriensis TaxID=218821 RepID=A0A1H5Q1M5_9PSEU|nr:helix-turn-helix domain-containing protein [Amycolatopsis pretoriensis]SEF19925.1 Helix-turn-helix domain-containing protein [Amycolatopsis pretoriensis]
MTTNEPSRPLDARMLRALAHPLRMRMLELLQADGPATATGLGKRVGESSGTTSWHLRLLAEVGLVEEDSERGTKRERWWKPAQKSTRMRVVDFMGDPDLAAPLDTYLRSVIEHRYEAEARFVSELPRWIDRWHDKAVFNDMRLSLTPEEAAAMSAEVDAVLHRYRRDARPGDDSVIAHWSAFPRRARPEESD